MNGHSALDMARTHMSCLKFGGFMYNPWRFPMLGANTNAPVLRVSGPALCE